MLLADTRDAVEVELDRVALAELGLVQGPGFGTRGPFREEALEAARRDDLENNTRDVAVVPALRPSMERFMAYFDRARRVILRGRLERGSTRERLRAVVGHALGFATWRSLVREQGLSRDEAVELMVRIAG